jgi:hypothetical protein
MDLADKERRSFVWLKYGMPASWTGLSCPGAQIFFRVLSGGSLALVSLAHPTVIGHAPGDDLYPSAQARIQM